MCNYKIYQTDADYVFRPWQLVQKKFNIDDYRVVYDSKVNIDTDDDRMILERLFEKFNVSHPSDYKARSLSMSDVVELIRGDEKRYYYCDTCGWKLIWTEKLN